MLILKCNREEEKYFQPRIGAEKIDLKNEVPCIKIYIYFASKCGNYLYVRGGSSLANEKWQRNMDFILEEEVHVLATRKLYEQELHTYKMQGYSKWKVNFKE